MTSCDCVLKSFPAGGIKLVKKMDGLLSLSKTIQDLELKEKGLPLEGILLSLTAGRLDNPRSVSQTVKDLKDYPLVKEDFNLDPNLLNVKTFYRGLEILGKNSQPLYGRVIDKVDERVGLDLREVFVDWTTAIVFGGETSLAERGYSKEHRGDKPQVKIGLAITARYSIPFYHSVEKGSVPDVEQMKSDYQILKHRLPSGNSYRLR